MTPFEHAFDPQLTALYTQQLNATGTSEVSHYPDSRALFYQLNQPGTEPTVQANGYAFIDQQLSETKHYYSALINSAYHATQLPRLQAPKLAPLASHLCSEDNLRQCLQQSSAVLLTQPCWLLTLCQAFASQSQIALQLMRIHQQLSRVGTMDLSDDYAAFLTTMKIRAPKLHHYAYSHNPELLPELIDFATTQLGLARFPRVLFPEILGFSLAYCQMPTLIEVCFPKQTLATQFFKLRQQKTAEQLGPLRLSIANYLALFTDKQQAAVWVRIQTGFYLYHQHMRQSRDQLSVQLSKTTSINQAMAALLQHKMSAAIGHHQQVTLQGKSLDQWFSGMPDNSQPFMWALQQSDYINQNCPADSHLLKLFTFNGPMFGVLDTTEQDILLNWIQAGNPLAKQEWTDFLPITQAEPQQTEKTTHPAYKNLNNRQRYYYLMNADLFPDIVAHGRAKAKTLLRACRCLSPPPFKHYTHQQFDDYIAALYHYEMKAYQPLQGSPKISRAAYIYALEQIAPMILIDGCWLQNRLAWQHTSPEIRAILSRIYDDELGNGQLQQNHPYIFQQLLNSLAIQVPPVHSTAFVKHPGFIDSAFDLPVYMLSLAHSSITFLPELLGLNMAIELSGLGKNYLQLVDEWQYWDIDPSIAKVHISIDNYASGHTFLAKKAVQLYMDEILNNTGDQAVMDKHWRRIYSGYASLQWIGTRFKLSLPIGYMLNKLKSSIK